MSLRLTQHATLPDRGLEVEPDLGRPFFVDLILLYFPMCEPSTITDISTILRGEQTAAALEANLTSLESKLDELLASFEAPAAAAAAAVPAASSTNGDEKGGSAAAGKSETGEAGQKKDG